MIARELLDTAAIPGGGELRLFRRALKGADEYSIMLGRIELMNSRLSGSEEALAQLTCADIKKAAARVLIGGLGMGFTLRAALTALPLDAMIEVAELIPAVVKWARGPMAAWHGSSLDDPRVTIRTGDVARMIGDASASYDAILLDVDNGPDGLTHDDNAQLYSKAGLQKARAALTQDGVLAIWSSGPDVGFTRQLIKSGFAVDERTVPARQNGKGAKHTIWLATQR